MESVGSPVEGSSGSYFTPLLISMAGVVCTTLAILAYHFIVVRFFLSRRRQRQRQFQEAAAAANLSLQPIGQNAFGVDHKVLRAIPILSYSTKNGELFPVDRSECVICLGELEEGDMVRLLPNCKHVFHNSCIDKWFLAHTNCPVCRSAIAVPPNSSVTSLLVEDGHGNLGHHDHDDDQVREGDREEASVNCSPHPHGDPDQGGVGVLSNSTSMAVQLPKRDHGLLRHCVSLVLLPVEGNDNNNNNKQQSFETTSLERSLSLDQSHASHVLISIQTERDEIDKPSSSSPSSSLSSSSSPSDSSKAVVMDCGSFKARSMRQFDRMSSVLIRSLSQLRSTTSANGHGVLPC